jgi:hypothetical protein
LEIRSYEFIQQIEDDRKEFKNMLQQFQNPSQNDDTNQEEIVQLRLLFLQHLSY